DVGQDGGQRGYRAPDEDSESHSQGAGQAYPEGPELADTYPGLLRVLPTLPMPGRSGAGRRGLCGRPAGEGIAIAPFLKVLPGGPALRSCLMVLPDGAA
ncbi:MAG TPA: hypothetical protein VGN49_09920, partial [Micrococcaceae bacterium]|nr:hypothetical protein [Micrococcaceae bacterium]